MNHKKLNHIRKFERFYFPMPFVCLTKNNSNLLTFYITLWIWTMLEFMLNLKSLNLSILFVLVLI